MLLADGGEYPDTHHGTKNAVLTETRRKWNHASVDVKHVQEQMAYHDEMNAVFIVVWKSCLAPSWEFATQKTGFQPQNGQHTKKTI